MQLFDGDQAHVTPVLQFHLFCVKFGLFLVFAQIGNIAAPAFGLARFADIAPMQDQPVVGVVPEFVGYRF